MSVLRFPDRGRPIPGEQPHVRIHRENGCGQWFVQRVGAPQARGRDDRWCKSRSLAVAHAVDLHERYGLPIVDWSRWKECGA